MSASLVGSEMCIRDSVSVRVSAPRKHPRKRPRKGLRKLRRPAYRCCDGGCLLYTSDAADDM
eukprot:5824864-Alexandrium_andersonii.AAC.1